MTNYDSGIYTDNPDDTMRYIASCDTVDAVKVVRCKDCKYAKMSRPPYGGICYLTEQWNRADFYCADGERR